MHARRSFVAGVVGAIVMTLIGILERAAGMFVDVEMMLGTIFLRPGNAAWALGLIVHLALGGLFGLLYAFGFERLSHRAGVGMGLVFGAAHLVFSGLALALVPAIHPLIPGPMYAPGIFMSGWGGGAFVVFVIEHLIFGAIVGGLYGPVLEPEGGMDAHARPT